MNDQIGPTTQFHPYQKPDVTPAVERGPSPVVQLLEDAGIPADRLLSSLRTTPLGASLERVRRFARQNPAIVLGGLAGFMIGLGILRNALPPRRNRSQAVRLGSAVIPSKGVRAGGARDLSSGARL
ncbi:MAG TPA: hypothetical protein VHL58_05180 [Thermoanaerobaculia bacterium]|nr:hypothetical protein [Thermoanaerobaculia bacterium]